jgi:hypothetical protein
VWSGIILAGLRAILHARAIFHDKGRVCKLFLRAVDWNPDECEGLENKYLKININFRRAGISYVLGWFLAAQTMMTDGVDLTWKALENAC